MNIFYMSMYQHQSLLSLLSFYLCSSVSPPLFLYILFSYSFLPTRTHPLQAGVQGADPKPAAALHSWIQNHPHVHKQRSPPVYDQTNFFTSRMRQAYRKAGKAIIFWDPSAHIWVLEEVTTLLLSHWRSCWAPQSDGGHQCAGMPWPSAATILLAACRGCAGRKTLHLAHE